MLVINLNESAPAKATTANQLFRASGPNAIDTISPPGQDGILAYNGAIDWITTAVSGILTRRSGAISWLNNPTDPGILTRDDNDINWLSSPSGGQVPYFVNPGFGWLNPASFSYELITASGMWTKPIGKSFFMALLIGGGAGGGGGFRFTQPDPSKNYRGGNGGGGNVELSFFINAALEDNETVVIGSGGSGGEGDVDGSLSNNNATDGRAGGSTQFAGFTGDGGRGGIHATNSNGASGLSGPGRTSFNYKLESSISIYGSGGSGGNGFGNGTDGSLGAIIMFSL